MNTYYVILTDELGDACKIYIDVPDLVENVTEWVQEEYPECRVLFIKPFKEVPVV